MKTAMTTEEMVDSLEIFDQTIGCNNCGNAWWAENATPLLEDFHAVGCPLKGRRDVHDIWRERSVRKHADGTT